MKKYSIKLKTSSSHKKSFSRILNFTTALLLAASLFACASSPESDTGDAGTPAGEPSGGASADVDVMSTDASPSAGGDATQSAASTTTPKTPAVEPEKTQPPKIVESCKDEPYGKYEIQSRDSIAKGLAATKANTFGVGFRDIAEHNKWSKMHNSLFKNVNDACGELTNCAKKYKKDKDTECVEQAKTFATWQKLSKSFANKAKSVETTQPPIICSLDPSLSDPANCFHGLAESINKVCESKECKEVSDCWRGVGFLDGAIIQASQACGFVHQDLKNCRGYTEATSRRKNKFAQCSEMQGRLKITVFPVL